MEHERKNQKPVPFDEDGSRATYDATVAKYKEAAPDKATIDTWLSRFSDGKFGDIV
ncbi:hypothetical protein EC912_103480 [Luteibacter rhizovicinus]|uniref:Uncharacterized protein n=1 Tax=Luteibacter rhizovicinus TaxID=242606 RepID=A0A4R3YQB8_9GAMM|nr:hypothetical protein [Luteibacter rhizovicinus]TCV94987.1 hypothetical protein EC912_103480 [Luteibacter rhizovicinus]